jgi:hypothetical protein
LGGGDHVEFVVRADGAVEVIPRNRPLLSLAGILGERRLEVSAGDMDADSAERVPGEHERSTS